MKMKTLAYVFTSYSILMLSSPLFCMNNSGTKNNILSLGTAVKLTIKCNKLSSIEHIKNLVDNPDNSQPTCDVKNLMHLTKKRKQPFFESASKKRKIEKEVPAQLLSLPETSIQGGVISKKPSIDELTKEFFMQDNDDVDVDWDAFSNLHGEDL